MPTTQTGTATKCHQTLTHMALGGTYYGYLTPAPILNAKGEEQGSLGDSSLTFHGSAPEQAIFGTEVATEALVVTTLGKFFINYETGYFKVISGGDGFARASWVTKVIAEGA